MKKLVALLFVCVAVLAVALTPAQAQQSFSLDFSGGSADCVSWINSAGGGALLATQSGGNDVVSATANAGGSAPECHFLFFTGMYIELQGFTSTSFSMLATGDMDIALILGGAGGTTVYSTNIVNPPSVLVTFSGEYDTIEIISSSAGAYFDNLVIGRPAGAAAPRINADGWGSPVALYCTEGGGLDIYDIVGDTGVFSERISDQAIANAIAAAAGQGNIRVSNGENTDVWILESGEIQINNGDYSYRIRYQNTCGALPEPEAVTNIEVEEEEDSGVIINRSR
jgi:hypothetical protein